MIFNKGEGCKDYICFCNIIVYDFNNSIVYDFNNNILYGKNIIIGETGRLLPQAPGHSIASHSPPPTQSKRFNKLVPYLFH